MSLIRVGGLQPFTTLDYPDALACIIFCQGCPWRCPYCHNPELLAAKTDNPIQWQDVLQFLDRRRDLLDAVVFSGGEALAQPRLAEAIKAVKERGFKVALQTGGAWPQRLAQCLPLLDFLALDIKHRFGKYESIVRDSGAAKKVEESLKLALDSGIRLQCRTTVHSDFFTPGDLQDIGSFLSAAGVKDWRIQAVRTGNTLLPMESSQPVIPPAEHLATGTMAVTVA